MDIIINLDGSKEVFKQFLLDYFFRDIDLFELKVGYVNFLIIYFRDFLILVEDI